MGENQLKSSNPVEEGGKMRVMHPQITTVTNKFILFLTFPNSITRPQNSIRLIESTRARSQTDSLAQPSCIGKSLKKQLIIAEIILNPDHIKPVYLAAEQL